MAEVSLSQVTKFLGGQPVVKDLSLTINDGESVCLLGPSGCGKTTTLNVIAGFLHPESGSVAVDGRPMEAIPPNKRNMGMVFQSYALFPHLTVQANVAFGLQMRRTERAELRDRVSKALRLVHLTGFEERYPKELSGGQQQRVALARALAINPSVLLLDEPLSNLDAKLRQQVRDEIVDIQRRTQVTMIFVTHDQEEALAISDRVAVMRLGELQQYGPPEEIYRRPLNEFVAGFVGDANFFRGELQWPSASRAVLAFEGRTMTLEGAPRSRTGDAVVLVRPEHVEVSGFPTERTPNCYLASLRTATFLGSLWRYQLMLGNQAMTASSQSPLNVVAESGSSVYVSWDPEHARVLKPEGSNVA